MLRTPCAAMAQPCSQVAVLAGGRGGFPALRTGTDSSWTGQQVCPWPWRGVARRSLINISTLLSCRSVSRTLGGVNELRNKQCPACPSLCCPAVNQSDWTGSARLGTARQGPEWALWYCDGGRFSYSPSPAVTDYILENCCRCNSSL